MALPFNDCKYALIYYKEFKSVMTTSIVNTNFDEGLFNVLVANEELRRTQICLASLSESDPKEHSAVVIQLGPTVEALQSTAQYCFELIHFRQKSYYDLLKEISLFLPTGRARFRPLKSIPFGASEPESDDSRSFRKELSGNEPRSTFSSCIEMENIVLPPLKHVPQTSAKVSTQFDASSAIDSSIDIDESASTIQSVTPKSKNRLEQHQVLVVINGNKSSIPHHQSSNALAANLLPHASSDGIKVQDGGANAEQNNQSGAHDGFAAPASQEGFKVNNSKLLTVLLNKINVLTVTQNAMYKQVTQMSSELKLLSQKFTQLPMAPNLQTECGLAESAIVSVGCLIPVSSVQDFETFQSEVSKNPTQNRVAVALLATVGGSDIRTAIYLTVKRLAVTEVLCQYNFDGSCGKKKFPDLMVSLICDAIRHNWPAAKDATIKTFIGKALKNAKDTLRKRKQSCSSTVCKKQRIAQLISSSSSSDDE